VATSVWLFAGLSLCAAPDALPEYSVGETAHVDVVTPIQLVVVDLARTEQLRQEEAKRVPTIFRFDPAASEEAEAGLRARFAGMQEKFLALLEEIYQRRKLNAPALTNERFARFVASFQNRNKDFPLSTNLARLWALGESDELIQADLVTRLQEVMGHYIRPDGMPNEVKTGPSLVRIISLAVTNPAPDLAWIEQHSTMFPRHDIYNVTRARNELQQRFDPEDRPTARFLASFVRANCFFETELTARSRAERTGPIFGADRYERGQLLVKRGQVIDAKTKAALDELRARIVAGQFQARASEVRAQAEAAVAQLRQQATLAEFKSKHANRQNRWLLGGLLLVATTSSLALWQLTRQRRTRALLPVPVGVRAMVGPIDSGSADAATSPVPPEIEGHAGQVVAWKTRAITAERRAAQTSALLRAGLIPHLAHWLKQKLVRGLLTERSHLVNAQQAAELEAAELEQRLAQLQAPLGARLQAYEKRIAELERELATKGEENRELIRAKIELTRKKLELERGGGRLTWN
jgi:membrane-associated HD superfamily phosphohydrolase